MTEAVSVMLLGLGGYGGYYVNYFLDVEHSDISAYVCAGVDPFPESCSRIGDLNNRNIPVYRDISAALARHQPELIIISTPIHTHVPLCLQALASGASVLLEKPLCGSLTEADQLADAAARAPGFVALGYQNRYSAAAIQFLADLQKDRFGQLISQKTLALRPRNTDYFQRSSWAGARYTAEGHPVFDGPAMNANAHFLYFQLLVSDACQAGPPKLRDCFLGRTNAIENHDSIACTFSCGDVQHLFLASHTVIGMEVMQFCYHFSKADVYLDGEGRLTAHFLDNTKHVYGKLSGGYEKIENCLRAVRRGPAPVCDIAGARRHIEVIEQIQQWPVVDMPQALVRDSDGLLWIEGMSELLSQAYTESKMPAICNEWAQAS